MAGVALGQAAVTAGLPWQVVTGSQRPDVRSMLATAALPMAGAAVGRSLRRPGLALGFTTLMDLLIVLVMGGGGALAAAAPRVISGLVTSVLSVVTGRRRGPVRVLAALGSVVTVGLQALALAASVGAMLDSGADGLEAVPGIVAMASALAVASRTTVMALRKGS